MPPEPFISDPTELGAERRSGQRLAMLGRVKVVLPTQREAVHLYDLGFGGFSLVAAVAFTPGIVYDVRLELDREQPVMVRARSVRSMRIKGPEWVQFITGFEFYQLDREAVRQIARVVDRMLDLQFSFSTESRS
jgi:hypothetical protein